MFGFSRKTDLALLIVTALAQSRRAFVPIRVLARERRLPYRFASQITSALARAGILEAREGARGGYRLTRDPATITVRDILEITEGSRPLVSCLDPAKHFRCPQKAWCTARRGMGVLQERLLDSLRSTTLADFIRAHAHAER